MYHYPKGSVLSFFEDLGNVIEKTVTSSSELIILDKFNVKADVQKSPDAMSLWDFLEIFNLQNHVSFPTHDKGHTLDLILADINNKVVKAVSQCDFISNHCFIDCQLDLCKPHKETQNRQCHNIKKMDKEKFQEGLVNLFSSIHIETSNAKVEQYQNQLISLIDTLGPIKRKKCKGMWNNLGMMIKLPKKYNSIDSKKEHGRFLEMSMTTLPFNTKRGMSVESYMQNRKHYQNLFSNISRDSKNFMQRQKKLLFRKETTPAKWERSKNISWEINNIFTSKINKITAGLVPTNSHPIDKAYIETKPQTNLTFSEISVPS